MVRTPVRVAALVCAALLLGSGCVVTDPVEPQQSKRATATSRAAPPERTSAPERRNTTGPTVRASGTVLGADGRPYAGGVVQITEHIGGLQRFFDLLAFAFTLGLAGIDCLSKNPTLTICRDEKSVSVRVASNGRWSAPLPVGAAEYDLVVTSLRGRTAGYPLMRLRFTAPETGVSLPTLRLWNARPTVRVDGRNVVVAWRALPASYTINDATYGTAMRPTRKGGPTGNMRRAGTVATVDARMLEDAAGTVVITAKGDVGRPHKYGVTWSVPPVAYPAPAGKPLSRGHYCRVTVGRTTQSARPCWITDGNAVEGYPGRLPQSCRTVDGQRQCTRSPLAAIVIDLGRAQRLGEVIVRGCSRACVIDASRDGKVWGPPQTLNRPEDIGNLDRQDARYVRLYPKGPVRGRTTDSGPPPRPPSSLSDPRVRQDEENDLSGLREVSVWPADPVPSALTPGAAGGAGGSATTTDGGDTTWWPIALAAIVLAAVVATLGYVAGRRRSRAGTQPPDPPTATGAGYGPPGAPWQPPDS